MLNFLSTTAIDALLATMQDIESDHYFTEVISEIADLQIDERALEALIENTARRVESDHYRTEVLSELLDEHQLGSTSMTTLFESLDDVESDNYLK